MKTLYTILIAGLFTLPPTLPACQAQQIGINPYDVSDWSGDRLYADVVKHSRAWAGFTVPWDNKDAVTLDANGFPKGDFALLCGTSPYLHGVYTVYISGQANVSLWNTSGQVTDSTYDPTSNITVAHINLTPPPNAGDLFVYVQNTKRQPTDQPGTGVNSIKVMRPIAVGAQISHDPSELFNRSALTMLKPFAVYRNLDQQSTNNFAQGATEWNTRTLPGDPIQTGHGGKTLGIAWEHQIALANTNGKDLWICIPYGATDDYLKKLFMTMRYGSDGVNPYTKDTPGAVWPALKGKLYFEWSNEVWNYGFQQAGFNLNDSNAEIATGKSDLNWDGNNNQWYLASRRVGKQLLRIRNVAAGVYGEASMGIKFFPVLMAQQGNPPTLEEPLKYLATKGQVNKFITHAGTAWYRGLVSQDFNEKPGMTQADVDAAIASGIDNSDYIAPQIAMIKAFGLKAACYEGGLIFGSGGVTNIVKAVHSDPKFGALVQQVISQYGQYDLICVYDSTDGGWALTDDSSNLNTVKYTSTVAMIPKTVQTIGSLVKLAQAAQTKADASALAVTKATPGNVVKLTAQAKVDADSASALALQTSKALKYLGRGVVQPLANGSYNLIMPTDTGFTATSSVLDTTIIPKSP